MDDLLVEWQEQNARGKRLSAEELCRDCPELVGEVQRRIGVLAHMERLVPEDSEPPTAQAADRNLLFGILALQMDFISRDDLITAMNRWVIEKKTPLGQLLLRQKALTADTHALLEALVQKHLTLHANGATKAQQADSSAKLRKIARPQAYKVAREMVRFAVRWGMTILRRCPSER
jgi:hypothetical protein